MRGTCRSRDGTFIANNNNAKMFVSLNSAVLHHFKVISNSVSYKSNSYFSYFLHSEFQSAGRKRTSSP